MAGDWIKMRAALVDHPKVIAMTRALQRHRPFRDWLTPGGGGQSNGQLLSDTALRLVTTSLLMKVWSIAREHGRFVGEDMVLAHSEIVDLDQMAGAPGVGAAMESVQWALPQTGVTLPNFKEFNVPMTPAEKQKAYRERNPQRDVPVTEALPNVGNGKGENVTSREEKRREEVKSNTRKAKKGTIPPNFCVSDRVKVWAALKGHDRLQERLEHFIGYAKRSGATYADWDAAFECAVREDWAKLNGKTSQFAPASRAGSLNAEEVD